jgi:hypothetical protein
VDFSGRNGSRVMPGVNYFPALQFLYGEVEVKIFRLFGRGFGAFALGGADTRRQ